MLNVLFSALGVDYNAVNIHIAELAYMGFQNAVNHFFKPCWISFPSQMGAYYIRRHRRVLQKLYTPFSPPDGKSAHDGDR